MSLPNEAAAIARPPVGICKSPAVLVALDVQLVLSSLLDHETFLGSPPEPMATKCLSLVTIMAWHPVGALGTTTAIVSGTPAEFGFH